MSDCWKGDLVAAVGALSAFDKHLPPDQRRVTANEVRIAARAEARLTDAETEELVKFLGLHVDERQAVSKIAATLKNAAVPIVQPARSSPKEEYKQRQSLALKDVGQLRQAACMVSVEGLRPDVTEEYLAVALAQYGPVVSLQLKDKGSCSARFAESRGATIAAQGGLGSIADKVSRSMGGWSEEKAFQLLEWDVDLTTTEFLDDEGSTLLAFLAAEGWSDFCFHFVMRSTRGYVNAQNKRGWSALTYAARASHLETTKVLLAAKARPNDATRDAGLTPLMLAASNRHAEICHALLGAKADLVLRSKDGRTPADFAGSSAARLLTLPPKQAPIPEASPVALHLQQGVLQDPAASTSRGDRADSVGPKKRRKVKINYQKDDKLLIRFEAGSELPEVLVGSIPEKDIAYRAGVRPGWGVLLVNGDTLPKKDREAFVKKLTPPVALEFGRPIPQYYTEGRADTLSKGLWWKNLQSDLQRKKALESSVPPSAFIQTVARTSTTGCDSAKLGTLLPPSEHVGELSGRDRFI